MQKKFIILPFILCLIFFISISFSQTCKNFNIYLIADTSFHTNCEQIDIDTFTLIDTPIIAVYDIESYNWSNHKIILSEECMKKNSDFFKKFLERPIHRPFIVCVGNKRIYLGRFVSPLSSYLPYCPFITGYLFSEDGPKEGGSYYLKIEKGLPQNENDLRCDKRIYKSLKKSGVLKE